ncbi:MAG: hypothetical protein P8183_23135, partial [Anaerolineae bacterium]
MQVKKYIVHALIWSVFLFACTAVPRPVASNQLAAAPYGPSPFITAVTYNWDTHVQLAPGSDNWSLTWANDGHQYTSWGDGGGFGGTNSDGRVSLGVARVEGNWNNYTGYNVWGGKNPESLNSPQDLEGKSYGIMSVDGVLYMWVSPGSDATNYQEARLA